MDTVEGVGRGVVALRGAGDCERGCQTSALGSGLIQKEKPGGRYPPAVCVAWRANVGGLGFFCEGQYYSSVEVVEFYKAVPCVEYLRGFGPRAVIVAAVRQYPGEILSARAFHGSYFVPVYTVGHVGALFFSDAMPVVAGFELGFD